jgi:hypothetical protein
MTNSTITSVTTMTGASTSTSTSTITTMVITSKFVHFLWSRISIVL